MTNPVGIPFVGSKISLISKSDIRYEGTLYTINTEDSTVALQDVRMFGTEGRRGDGKEIPPSNKVFEYIIFRGSDIKDLTVCETPSTQNPATTEATKPTTVQPEQKKDVVKNDDSTIPSQSKTPPPTEKGNSPNKAPSGFLPPQPHQPQQSSAFNPMHSSFSPFSTPVGYNMNPHMPQYPFYPPHSQFPFYQSSYPNFYQPPPYMQQPPQQNLQPPSFPLGQSPSTQPGGAPTKSPSDNVLSKMQPTQAPKQTAPTANQGPVNPAPTTAPTPSAQNPSQAPTSILREVQPQVSHISQPQPKPEAPAQSQPQPMPMPSQQQTQQAQPTQQTHNEDVNRQPYVKKTYRSEEERNRAHKPQPSQQQQQRFVRKDQTQTQTHDPQTQTHTGQYPSQQHNPRPSNSYGNNNGNNNHHHNHNSSSNGNQNFNSNRGNNGPSSGNRQMPNSNSRNYGYNPAYVRRDSSGRGVYTKVNNDNKVYTEEFDFEKANAMFHKDKVIEEILEHKKHVDVGEEEIEAEVPIKPVPAELTDEEPSYVKTQFFDKISCESLNYAGGKDKDRKIVARERSDQRKLDIETFGDAAKHQRGFGGSYGHNRSYSGGNNYNRRPYHNNDSNNRGSFNNPNPNPNPRPNSNTNNGHTRTFKPVRRMDGGSFTNTSSSNTTNANN